MHKLARIIIVYILTWEAMRVLKKWKPTIILVSGSVGKTTTKDAIYHVLHAGASVRKSEKSYNSEIGVPLTILGLPNAWSNPIRWLENIWRGYRMLFTEKKYPTTLVLEVGSDHPGDIADLMKWLRPDISIVTSLPEVPVHVENFQSPEDVRREDSLVVDALSADGVYVANLDDTLSRALIKSAEERNIRTVTYGFAKNAMVRGSYLRVR